MPKSHLVFCKTRLERLPVPAKGTAYHYDQKTPGLCIAVMPSGRKVFYSYRWIEGRPKRIRIGGFPEITIETARKQAAAINAAIAGGRENGRPRANRVVGLLKAMYNQARREWGYEGRNPARDVTRLKEVPRDRFLTPAEVPRLLQAVLPRPGMQSCSRCSLGPERPTSWRCDGRTSTWIGGSGGFLRPRTACPQSFRSWSPRWRF